MSLGTPAFRALAATLGCALALPLLATSLSLPEAQRRALERSRQLDAYDASVSASLEMAHAADQLPDPVLRLGLESVPADGPDRFSLSRDFMTMRRVGVSQQFTRKEVRGLRRERFEREAGRTRAERLASTAAIQRDTALAWLDRHYLGEMRAAAAGLVEASAAQVESAESMYRGGRGSQAEVFGTRAAVALARDRLADIERRARAAAIELGRWTGVADGEALGPLPEMSAVRLGEGPLEDHLSTHPEIMSVDREADVMATEARIAGAARTPDWTWEVAYQQRGSSYANMFSIGVSMPLPWDTGNRQDREVAAKLAAADGIHARRDEILRAHVAEVRAMLDEWRVGRERQARYRDEILPLSRERTSASLAAYAGASATLAEVVAARTSEFEMRLQALQLDREVARLWARLNFLIPEAQAHAPRHAAISGRTR